MAQAVGGRQRLTVPSGPNTTSTAFRDGSAQGCPEGETKREERVRNANRNEHSWGRCDAPHNTLSNEGGRETTFKNRPMQTRGNALHRKV